MAAIAYLLALVILNSTVKSDVFWTEMFTTPRFRTGFIIYSFPFFFIGTLLIAVGRWTPDRTSFVIARTVLVGISILVLVLAIGLMNVFGSGLDFKLSGP